MSVLAIDFGSSNTVLSRWNVVTGCPETIQLPEIARPRPYHALVPSRLYLKDAASGHAWIGQQAIDRVNYQQHERCFNQIKRHLASRSGYVPELDGVRVTPEYVGKLFLAQLFDRVRAQQIHPQEAIVTVPVQSYERYLRWLETCNHNLWELAATTRVRALDEPTAAALGYAIAEPGKLVLVIDFGGGTLDLSLVRTPRAADLSTWGEYVGEASRDRPETKVEVIAKTGQILGGEDIDRWLLEDFLSQQQCRNLPSQNILLHLMERIKIALSSAEFAAEVFFDVECLEAYDIIYTQAQLTQILQARGFYRVLQTALDEVVNRAAGKGILKIDILDILLVGGTTLVPSVRGAIAKVFPHARIYDDKPFEAVAHGALMLDRGMRVRDHLFHSYAIRYWHGELQQWQYQPLFLKGQTYPTTQPYELILRASQFDQETIELVVGELEKRPAGSMEVVFDGDRLVTTVEERVVESFSPLTDDDAPQAIATLDPLGQPGCDRLKVSFQIGTRRDLRVTVIDLSTQKVLLRDRAVAELR